MNFAACEAHMLVTGHKQFYLDESSQQWICRECNPAENCRHMLTHSIQCQLPREDNSPFCSIHRIREH